MVSSSDEKSNISSPNRYGLIGEKLSHSFSKLIHERLANYCYDLIEIPKMQLDTFMKKHEFSAINVTIPYKEAVMPYLDFIDESARKIGSVNTIINKNGKLYGYNTDYMGFSYTLQKRNIVLKDKTVLIMGSGGTCKTVFAVAKNLEAKEILIASRKSSADTISYEDAIKRKEIQVIINASPVGMFPNNDDKPIDLCRFKKLEAVVDVIYNPLKTKLLLQAEKLCINNANGLLMLVAQAKFAVEYFLDSKIPNEKIDEIYTSLCKEQSNLVLIGMPSCGKSVLARLAADSLDRVYIDMDKIIVENENMPIADIFALKGEPYFRKLESSLAAELSKRNSLIISTGGGIIKSKESMDRLRQNGVIGFIDRPIDKLLIGNGRPLSNSSEKIKQLYSERYSSYKSESDFTLQNDKSLEFALENLITGFNESFEK